MLSPRRTKTIGFTTIELLLIVVLMGLLAAVVVPNYIRARNRPSDNACVANLKQIARAKEQWALEHKKSNGTPVDAAAINGYMLKGRAPQCPNNGTYSYHPLGTSPTCSLAVRGHTL